VKVFTGAPAERDLSAINTTVQMDVYMDFTCKYASETWDTMLKLKEVYGDNLRVRVRHFPTGLEGVDVASGIQCARDQSLHMQYINTIFDNTDALDMNSLKNYAWKTGLDVIAFQKCVDDKTHIDRVKEDFSEGVDMGVRSTPTYVIDGEILVGTKTISRMQDEIDTRFGI